MDNTREKLIELLKNADDLPVVETYESFADFLIASGVTFATDSAVRFRKFKKGDQPCGYEAFIVACPTCKNQGSTLCRKCRMEVESGYDPKPEFSMTNADRIRAMSDEELSKWIDWLFGRCEWCDTDKMATDDCNDVECTSCILEWLKQPVED